MRETCNHLKQEPDYPLHALRCGLQLRQKDEHDKRLLLVKGTVHGGLHETFTLESFSIGNV